MNDFTAGADQENAISARVPNPPDSTHCGLMPLAAGREEVGEPHWTLAELVAIDKQRVNGERE